MLLRVYITSSGLRSAELPFAHGSSDCLGSEVENILLKLSGEEGGGKVCVIDMGRCREKKFERLRSVDTLIG